MFELINYFWTHGPKKDHNALLLNDNPDFFGQPTFYLNLIILTFHTWVRTI